MFEGKEMRFRNERKREERLVRVLAVKGEGEDVSFGKRDLPAVSLADDDDVA